MFGTENLGSVINGKLLDQPLPLLEVVEDLHDSFQVLMEDGVHCLVPDESLSKVSERLMRNVHVLLVLGCCDHFIKLCECPFKALGYGIEA